VNIFAGKLGGRQRSDLHRLPPGGFLDAFDDANISGATAKISYQGFTDFFFTWIRISIKECPGGDQDTRCAKTALDTAGMDHGFLDRTELSFTRQANTMQLFTGSPFNRTVQAPHSPAEQPFFVPVNARLSRSMRIRVMLDGTLTCSSPPLTVRLITWKAMLSSEEFTSEFSSKLR
jgi:hypothetical protein